MSKIFKRISNFIISQCCFTVSWYLVSYQDLIRFVGIPNVRLNEINAPANTTSRSDLSILEKLPETDKNGNIIFDTGCQDERMIKFRTESNCKLLQISTSWFMDGTSKTVPTFSNNCIPYMRFVMIQHCRYCIACYQRNFRKLLTKIKEVVSHLRVQKIITDFEKATLQLERNIRYWRWIRTKRQNPNGTCFLTTAVCSEIVWRPVR